MRTPPLILLALLLGLPLAAAAEDKAAATHEVGQQTREALELQRSGQSASTTERPASGEVADRMHQRYVDSFSHPIPKSFKDEEREFVKGSN
jgi:hypothetical protein